MYSDWTSLENELVNETENRSVLSMFTPNIGRDVVANVVNGLTLGLPKPATGKEPNKILTDEDVKWIMQIICFGLSLPATDKELISECVNIYCRWLTCLTTPDKFIPNSLLENPNLYVQPLLHHLLHVFEPRKDANAEFLARQLSLCYKILETTYNAFLKSTKLSLLSSEAFLKFFLSTANTILSLPIEKDGIGSPMSERLLNVLFGAWIHACARSFPSPPYWKTLQEFCCMWRHHEALVTQWHRINIAFTFRLLRNIYGEQLKPPLAVEEELKMISPSMSNDCIAQCWFRFLHIIGNPADLSRPKVIGNTQKFYHAALVSQVVLEPHQHECLHQLPRIFHRAMKSIATLVHAFLSVESKEPTDVDWLMTSFSVTKATDKATTPPILRKPRASILPHINKNAPKDSSARSSLSDTWPGPTVPTTAPIVAPTPALPNNPQPSENKLSAFRPTVNSLLHLFATWLNDAALIGVTVHGSEEKVTNRGRTASLYIDAYDAAKLQHQLDHSNNTDAQMGHSEQSYEMGRAQACGTLCKIFCSRKTGEDILPVYLSRFYILLSYGLAIDQDTVYIPSTVSSILLNSTDLFRIDLPGVHVLLPQLLHAIHILTHKFRYKVDYVDEDVELRQASISILLSISCLPLQFRDVILQPILENKQSEFVTTMFLLKKPITEIVLKLLTDEIDPSNTQMLLSCVAALVLDCSLDYQQSEENIFESMELFCQTASLICHRLMNSWKNELTNALCAMEVLIVLARVSFDVSCGDTPTPSGDRLMCKRVVNWLCEFVISQCGRPAPAHSKDLHSMIVMAYQCLTVWLVHRGYLLQDSETLYTVFQVVELGISGSRSQPKSTDIPKLKGEKELKPVSQRVKDAAEALLASIIDHVEYTSGNGSDVSSSEHDESSLLMLHEQISSQNNLNFQYFVIDNCTILALLEQPLSSQNDNLPTLIALIRGTFGRHAWVFQMKQYSSSHQQHLKAKSSEPSNAEQLSNLKDTGVPCDQKIAKTAPVYFPDSIDNYPNIQADLSIPKLEDTMLQYKDDLSKLEELIDEQNQLEETAFQTFHSQTTPPSPAIPMSPCKDFQTMRLFFSQFSFHSPAASKNSIARPLLRLDNGGGELKEELKMLDAISVRTADVVHLYYVKVGQHKLPDILGNMLAIESLDAMFVNLLRQLGKPMKIGDACSMNHSFLAAFKKKNKVKQDNTSAKEAENSLYDGRRELLYWSDITTELAFIVPSKYHLQAEITMESQVSVQSESCMVDSDASSTASEAEMKQQRSLRHGAAHTGQSVHVLLIWLESIDDRATFPIGELSSLSCHRAWTEGRQKQAQPPPLCLVFVHPLATSLLRIHLHFQHSKIGDACPLVDGMVVSERILGELLRQTAVNIFRRKALASELYQPPHVRRRLKINNIIDKFKMELSDSQLSTSLFQNDYTSFDRIK